MSRVLIVKAGYHLPKAQPSNSTFHALVAGAWSIFLTHSPNSVPGAIVDSDTPVSCGDRCASLCTIAGLVYLPRGTSKSLRSSGCSGGPARSSTNSPSQTDRRVGELFRSEGICGSVRMHCMCTWRIVVARLESLHHGCRICSGQNLDLLCSGLSHFSAFDLNSWKYPAPTHWQTGQELSSDWRGRIRSCRCT